MNDKYSPVKCAQYGRRLAAKLCEQHFGAQPHADLDGPGIQKFTAIRQINLLVIRQLLTKWQAEAARLESPYFDFSAVPVQAALVQFMNTLSRHIRLKRESFEPLLAAAAAETLGIVANPVGTFQHLLLGDAETPTVAILRENLRYFDVDKAFYAGFVDSLPSTTAPSRDFFQHRFELYHAANYKAHQPMQKLVSELSTLLPLTTADLLEDGPVSSSAPVSVTAPAPSAIATVPVAPPVPTPAVLPALPVAETASFLPVPVALSHPLAQEDTSAIPLHEKLKASQPATQPLAETLRAGIGSPTVNVLDRGPKVVTLREAISINQRFSFINELFGGENMDYHAAIQHLDAQATADQARVFVTQELARRYDWSKKDEHVNKLLKLIERKFA